MKTEEKLIEMFGRENHFKVPEGYFDTLSDSIISQLPEEPVAQQVKMSVWKKYRVRLLAAACVVSVLFSAGLYISLNDRGNVPQTTYLSATNLTETTIESEDAFDEMADYVMVDKEDMYAYIAEE